jgi:hypothetical protein
MAAMARANFPAALMSWKKRAGDSYRAKVVFAFRSFEIDPASRSKASAILALIPRDEEEDAVWHELGQSFCDAEPISDMEALGRFGVRLPRDLSRAILLVPDKMPEYVSYAGTSIADPDSDYAERMEVVCRAKHKEFSDAVDKLPTRDKNWLPSKDKTWFVTTVFDPMTCRAIAHPEAD